MKLIAYRTRRNRLPELATDYFQAEPPPPSFDGGHYHSRGATSADMPSNYYLNLRNVGRCPHCGALVDLPCRACKHPATRATNT